MAIRTTALLPQILFHGTRTLHSEIPGKGSEDVTQRPDGIAGDKCSTLVSSSSPMPNSIQSIHERNTAANSGGSDELAIKANSTSPNMSSKESIKSTCPNQSSSDDSSDLVFLVALLLLYFILSIFIYLKGRKHGARNLAAQLPDCKFFIEREALRKEEEKLKSMDDDKVLRWAYGLQEKEKELAEKVETLDRKELEHLRQRAMLFESKLKTQNVSIEAVNARERPHGAVNAGVSADKTYARKVGGLYLETADLQPRDPLLGIEERGPLGCSGWPNYSGAQADSPMRQAEVFPSAKVVPQDSNRVVEVYKIFRTAPYEDDSMAHAKLDTETIGSRMTNAVLESLSADNDAAMDKMGQIRRVKEALKSREKELEAQVKDRKKRIQELSAPTSEGTSSIASRLVLGSALGFGITIIMSVIGN